MTGEISLRGLVLPVGGIKREGHRRGRGGHHARDAASAQPSRFRRDPQEVREKLEFIWLERVDDAVAAALAPATKP